MERLLVLENMREKAEAIRDIFVGNVLEEYGQSLSESKRNTDYYKKLPIKFATPHSDEKLRELKAQGREIGGYFSTESGVDFICLNMEFGKSCLNSLVHELEHAAQEFDLEYGDDFKALKEGGAQLYAARFSKKYGIKGSAAYKSEVRLFMVLENVFGKKTAERANFSGNYGILKNLKILGEGEYERFVEIMSDKFKERGRYPRYAEAEASLWKYYVKSKELRKEMSLDNNNPMSKSDILKGIIESIVTPQKELAQLAGDGRRLYTDVQEGFWTDFDSMYQGTLEKMSYEMEVAKIKNKLFVELNNPRLTNVEKSERVRYLNFIERELACGNTGFDNISIQTVERSKLGDIYPPGSNSTLAVIRNKKDNSIKFWRFTDYGNGISEDWEVKPKDDELLNAEESLLISIPGKEAVDMYNIYGKFLITQNKKSGEIRAYKKKENSMEELKLGKEIDFLNVCKGKEIQLTKNPNNNKTGPQK